MFNWICGVELSVGDGTELTLVDYGEYEKALECSAKTDALSQNCTKPLRAT